jgi:uncharacterized protein YxeA
MPSVKSLVWSLIFIIIPIIGISNTEKREYIPTENYEKAEKTQNIECWESAQEQLSYLENEDLFTKYTFNNYKTKEVRIETYADLDINNKYVRAFRSAIRSELEKKPPNFASHYTIVGIGMTGTGVGYYIVDRITGETSPILPYVGLIDFRLDSNLIIINPREQLLRLREELDRNDLCAMENSVRLIDLRPFYFIWNNNKLEQLAPKSIMPERHKFWDLIDLTL